MSRVVHAEPVVDTGKGKALHRTLGWFLAWVGNETPAWKPVKDKPKNQHGQCLLSHVVTTRVGLGGEATRRDRMKKRTICFIWHCCVSPPINAGEALEWGRGWQQ